MTRKQYDVILIGAGSVGAPAAFSLAEAGVRTLVIDKAPSVGQGSNKTAIGGIRATHSDPAKIRLCLRSIEIFATWKELHGDEIEWHRGGYSFVAYREEEEKTLKALLEIQHSYGLNIDWLDKQALLEVIPALNQDGLIGGTFSPDDGSASPLLAIHALLPPRATAGGRVSLWRRGDRHRGGGRARAWCDGRTRMSTARTW